MKKRLSVKVKVAASALRGPGECAKIEAVPMSHSRGELSDKALWGGTIFAFGGSFFFFLLIYGQFPVLYDGDSYYHLAVARTYAGEGFIGSFPWTRFSVFYDSFGDKEFLFHLLLAPFTVLADPTAGGKAALALCNALMAALLAHLGLRSVGPPGLMVPLWLYGTSVNFTIRMLRLRAEILALPLLILVVLAAASRRYLLLGLAAGVYTLEYTAFHMVLALCGAFFLYERAARRRWDWKLLLFPAAGSALGLAVHPQFPANVQIWFIQNVHYFRLKGVLDVGPEILPPTLTGTILLNLGWLAGMALLWRAAEKKRETLPEDRLGPYFLMASGIYGALYIFMQRFALYLVPFLTLALLFGLNRRGLRPARQVTWWGGFKVPLAVSFALCLALALPSARYLFDSLWRGGIWLEGRRSDWESFSRSLPESAAVAAPWSETGPYIFWAPQAAYLNVLDPVFMALPSPRAYWTQRRIFEGQEPDVPLAAASILASDYVAFSPLFGLSGHVYRRLETDPRAEIIHNGYNKLFRVTGGDNQGFVLDWKAVPAGVEVPPSRPEEGWPFYPRAAESRWRHLEGYVDALRLDPPAGCDAFVHAFATERPSLITYEFAPYGPSSLWMDGELRVTVDSPPRAVLGQGAAFTAQLGKGLHVITVRTCTAEGYKGFYLLERERRGLMSNPG